MQIKFINEKNKEKKNRKPKSKKEPNIKEDIILFHDKTRESNHSDENHQIKTHCGIHNGVYINNFDKLSDNKSNSNFSSSTKEINDDSRNISSKSSSTSSNRSNMSIERSIINSGLKRFADNNSSNHLGPFNFRLLLKPTDHLPPTESLRKRKLIFTSSPHIPDKNIKF